MTSLPWYLTLALTLISTSLGFLAFHYQDKVVGLVRELKAVGEMNAMVPKALAATTTAKEQLAAEYIAYQMLAEKDLTQIRANYEKVCVTHKEETATLWEVVDAKLDAHTAADLSDAVSRLLSARRLSRTPASGAATPAPDKPATVPDNKPA